MTKRLFGPGELRALDLPLFNWLERGARRHGYVMVSYSVSPNLSGRGRTVEIAFRSSSAKSARKRGVQP